MYSKMIFCGSMVALLSGCTNPFSNESSADARYSPGWKQEAPLEQTWDVNSTHQADYTFTSPELLFESSGVTFRPLNMDDSNSLQGFGGGTYTDTAWMTNVLELDVAGKAAGLGSFTSRFFSTNTSISWTNLTIDTPLAMGRPYPDNKAVETNYAPFNLDMTGNVLLLHMNELAWNGTPGEVVDSSGSGNPGVAVGGVSTHRDGRFHRAGAFVTGGEYVQIADSNSLDITGAITLEAWMYPTVYDGGLHAIISKRNGFQVDSAYALFLLSNSVIFDLGDSRFFAGGSFVMNSWSHVVATYDPAAGNEWSVYLNNVLVGNSYVVPSNYLSYASPLHIGAAVNDGSVFDGRLDEVAIYNRALSVSEIAARYYRGKMRLELQARSCNTQADCLAQPFLGPDGTAQTSYSQYQSSSTTPTTNFALSGFSGKHLQYKVSMETEAGSTFTPGLRSVAVTPIPYALTISSLASNTGLAYKSLSGFSAELTGDVRFQLSKDGIWYYWNGTAWAEATLDTQTNTVAEVNQNISSLSKTTGEGLLNFKAFMTSGNGTQKPVLTSVTVSATK